jgi:hypothetical protein
MAVDVTSASIRGASAARSRCGATFQLGSGRSPRAKYLPQRLLQNVAS